MTTTHLAELIRRKHAVLVELCEVGRRQMGVVERGETSALLELLAVKQTMISLLQQVERELAPFHAEDPADRAWSTPGAREQCAQQAAECSRLLVEVVELERQSADRLAIRRTDVASQLRHVYAAGQARNAYEAQR